MTSSNTSGSGTGAENAFENSAPDKNDFGVVETAKEPEVDFEGFGVVWTEPNPSSGWNDDWAVTVFASVLTALDSPLFSCSCRALDLHTFS